MKGIERMYRRALVRVGGRFALVGTLSLSLSLGLGLSCAFSDCMSSLAGLYLPWLCELWPYLLRLDVLNVLLARCADDVCDQVELVDIVLAREEGLAPEHLSEDAADRPHVDRLGW